MTDHHISTTSTGSKPFEIDRHQVKKHNRQGISNHSSGELENAIAEYDRAIALNPNYTQAYNNRGLAKGQLGDLAGAIADYNRAINLDNNYAKAYYNRALNKAALKDRAGAIADFDRAANLFHEQGDLANYQKAIEKQSRI